MDATVYNVLKSHLHSKALLKVGESYGFSIGKSSSKIREGHSVINLGSIPHEDLLPVRSTVPWGYEEEEEEEEERNALSESITLSFAGTNQFAFGATARLAALEVFPRNCSTGPILTLLSNNDEPLDKLELNMGESITFDLKFTVTKSFCGHLKRLVLFTFEVTETVELLVSKTTTLKMGMVVLGSVVPRGVDRGMRDDNGDTAHAKARAGRKLSVEAKPFSPISAITHFDTPCSLISISTSPYPLYDAFRPPPNYCNVLNHPTLTKGAGFAENLAQEIGYLQHLRANTLEQVMHKLELCSVGDLVEKHALSAALSHQYCQDILANHVKLINLEEIQTKIDIAQYDLHYVRLTVSPKPVVSNSLPTFGAPAQLLVAKLKIKGSSENRPKIGLGAEILLRPVEEDLPLLMQYGLMPHVFEIRGVCIHYQLSTEEATFEFPGSISPPHVPFAQLVNALRYHVRFDYERYGFLLIQWAVGSLMSNRHLVEALFPNHDTIARLKHYFKTSRSPPKPPGLMQGADSGSGSVPSTLLGRPSSSEALHAAPLLAVPIAAPITTPAKTTITYSQVAAGPASAQPTTNPAATPNAATYSTSTPALSNTTQFNAQQLKAITSIAALAADSRFTDVQAPFVRETRRDYLPLPPFIIFGPPGTGKTSTVVEAILRICRSQPKKRILACAPSDAAADVLCDRLSRALSPQQLFRLNWWQRVAASVPAKLRPFTHDVNDIFELPSVDVLHRFQVIVCNCGTAGVLKTLPQNTPLKFDVVVVDEASQAIEAEILVPLELCKPSGVMVLSGDTNQLGPSTRCPLFSVCTDGASLQERLLRLPFYDACRPPQAAAVARGIVPRSSHRHNPQHQHQQLDSSRNTSAINLAALHRSSHSIGNSTSNSGGNNSSNSSTGVGSGVWSDEDDGLPLGVFLYKNYRSHRRILQVPSALFYGGALQECADAALTESLCGWDRLARPGDEAFPLLMIGVDGQHEHEVESPSFFNAAEIAAVVEVCRDLLTSASLPPGAVAARDIGVIAAFRQQVLKLRLALRAAGMSNVNVGSVEDFQGQEVKVVVISTVLSEWVERHEAKGAIGLLGDPKRFNVAVTRGMALCVVVGQPQLLYADPHWRELLRYCVKHGAYSGMDISSFLRRNPHSRSHSHHHYSTDNTTNSSSASSTGHTNTATSGLNTLAALADALPTTATTTALPTTLSTFTTTTTTAAYGYEEDAFLFDDEDEELLNSVTEVANSMLAGYQGAEEGIMGMERSQGLLLRGLDMEWRNIL